MLHEALVERSSPRIRRLAGNRAREVRFHRFLRNPKVSAAEMAACVGDRTGLRCQGRDIAVIQDTSEISVGGVAAGRAGFGPVGKGGATRGLLVHAAIAVDAAGALLRRPEGALGLSYFFLASSWRAGWLATPTRRLATSWSASWPK